MIRVMKKFYILLNRHQKGRVIILFFMMLLGGGFEVAGVSMMLPLITAAMDPNIITNNKFCKYICQIFQITNHVDFVIWCIAAVVIIYIIKAAYLTFEYSVQYRFVFNNRFITQSKLLEVYLHRPYEYFLSAQSGEIIRVVQEDAGSSFNMLTVILTFLTEAVVSAALIATVFVINPFMTVFVAATLLILMVVILKCLRPLLRREGEIYQKTYAETNKWLLQSISGIKEVKVTQTEDFFLDNFVKYGKKMVNAARWNSTLQNIPRNLIELVSVCSMMIVLGIMIAAGHEMESLLPSLSAFVMAAVKLLPSANRMMSSMTQVVFYEPALDNMLENLADLEEQVSWEDREAKELPLTREIRFKGIDYTYPSGEKKIFSQAELVVPVGSSVGVIGASGAGKTTAVDILLGLLKPQAGQVLADGVDVSENMPGWLAHIGYIPQMIFMLDDTIRANIVFGHVEADSAKGRGKPDFDMEMEKAVWAALEEAQLADFVRSLPKGIDTAIGERGVRLSGGQRQRIGIARALFTNPDVLIFDEATSALDNETEEAIMQSVNALHGKKTMIIIAHRLTTIEGCDMVYRAENGKLVNNR
ncbi:ABC transporter ATP-binding protein [bacterium D16-51]|nr:ABC transporter ATP-binding protein [bacterium D16-59]RKI56985.1 ABC transporter ATP-binding protein [bacterium D16-51]